jgi:outer membrane cobalamin receptor
VYALGEVVVSGKREEGVFGKSEGVEATETVYTVTSKEIRDRGARTLDQAIALVPGVNVRVGGEGVPRIDIRGFRTRHVLLLLDGIPVNSAFDQQFDPTLVPTENIAEIKLTAGPASLLYGQGGLGGVINVVTTRGTPGVQGMLAAETGDHAPYLVRGSASGGTDRFDYFVSGSTYQVDGFPISDGFRATGEQGGGYRNNSDSRKNNVLGTVGFTPTKDLALGLTVNYNQGSYGKTGSVINDPFDLFAAPPKYVRVDDFSGVSLQLAADYAVTDRLSVRGWGFLNRHSEELNQYDNAGFNSFNLSAGSFREHVETSIQGATLQPCYQLGSAGKLSFSLSAERDNWQNNGPVTLAQDSFSQLSVDKALSQYSAAIEYEVTPLPGLGLVAGYGHYWQTRSERNEDDYSILAGASYDLFKETRLKASFKRNVRFPSLGDLYDVAQGNANLAAERSFTYEGGVEQQLPMLSEMQLTGFYTQAENLIQNDQTVGRNMNLTEIRFTGFEVTAATHYVQKLLLRASYAYLNSQDRSRAGRDEQQYTPGSKLTLETKYDFDCGLTPNASLLYVGNQYFYTKNNVTPVQKAKLNDYTLINLKLSQKLQGGKLTVYIGANNVFDENYETSYGFPLAGRFIYGGVELRI